MCLHINKCSTRVKSPKGEGLAPRKTKKTNLLHASNVETQRAAAVTASKTALMVAGRRSRGGVATQKRQTPIGSTRSEQERDGRRSRRSQGMHRARIRIRARFARFGSEAQRDSTSSGVILRGE